MTAVRQPDPFYRALRSIKPLRALVRSGRNLLAQNRLTVWQLAGRERASGLSLEILFSGQIENKNYIAQLAFDNTGTEAALGRRWIRNLVERDTVRLAGDEALVIVGLNEAQRERYRDRFKFQVPCWIGGEIDLGALIDHWRYSKNSRYILGQLRKSETTYEITRDRDAFERFYYGMYLPYITNVYGNHAFLMSHEDMVGQLDRCELVLVKRHGEYVAGQILVYDGRQVRGWSVGVKDGDRSYVEAGAIKALDYLLPPYLRENGYNFLHLGGSRPFLRDGVLAHKKRLGLRLTDHSAQGFAVKLPATSAGAWAFLASNPFVQELDGQYWGSVFHAGPVPPSEEQLRQLYRQHNINGMTGMIVYLQQSAMTPVSVPQELQGKVRIEYV